MPARIAVIESDKNLTLKKKLSKLHEFDFVSVQPDEIADSFRQGAEIVLMDLRMPQKAGLEVLNALKDMDAKHPIVLLTVSSEHMQLEQVRDFIQRTFEMKRLQDTVGTPELRQGKWREISLPQIARGMGISHAVLARILGVSERNLARWITGETTPRGQHDISVQKLKYLFFLLRRGLGEESIPKYLRAANDSLGGRTPLMALQDGDMKSVEADLQGLIEGVYA